MSSTTNFAFILVIARQAAPGDFGSFSVVFAVYVLVLWVGRSLVMEPFVVRHALDPVAHQRAEGGAAVGAAVAVGVFAGAGMMLAGSLLGGATGSVLSALGLAMPALLGQDAYRYILIGAGRGRAAAANDTIWFGLQAVAMAALFATTRAGTAELTLVFGGAAAVAGCLGAFQSRVLPALSINVWWGYLRRHRDLGVPFVVEVLAVNGMMQLSLPGIAALAGVEAVGALRAATLLFSPLTVLFSGVMLAGIPEAARLRHRSLPMLFKGVTALAAAMMFATALWGAALALVPAGLGRSILGSNWSTARDVLAPVTIVTAANAWIVAVLIGLRGMGAARQSLRARLWATPVVLVATLLGAAVAGATGAGLGLALATCLSGALTWYAFRAAIARETHAPSTSPDEPSGTAPMGWTAESCA